MKTRNRVAGAAIAVACLLLPASAGAEVLYDNIDLTSPQSINSQDFNAANNAFDAMAADDFVIPAGEKWTITGALVRGNNDGSVPATSANVTIFADAGGTPGAEVFSGVATATDYPRMNLTFAAPELSAGIYWFGVSAILDPGASAPFNQWYWAENSEPVGAPAMYRNPGNGFSTGCTSFTVKSTCIFVTGDPVHPAPGQSFNLSGTRVGPPVTPSAGEDPACTAAKDALDKATAKLKKAKDKAKKAKGAAKKKKAKAKVKKAKDALEKAQAAVEEAC